MKTIHKYLLSAPGDQAVWLPKDAESLHVAEQHGRLCLWALVDPCAPVKTRLFSVVGTGQAAEDGMKYVGTALCSDGSLVWHVFEKEAR